MREILWGLTFWGKIPICEKLHCGQRFSKSIDQVLIVNNLNKVSNLYFLSDDWSKLFSYVIERIRVCDKEQWALLGDQRWNPLLTFTILFLPILVSNNPQPKEAYTDQNVYFLHIFKTQIFNPFCKIGYTIVWNGRGQMVKGQKKTFPFVWTKSRCAQIELSRRAQLAPALLQNNSSHAFLLRNMKFIFSLSRNHSAASSGARVVSHFEDRAEMPQLSNLSSISPPKLLSLSFSQTKTFPDCWWPSNIACSPREDNRGAAIHINNA